MCAGHLPSAPKFEGPFVGPLSTGQRDANPLEGQVITEQGVLYVTDFEVTELKLSWSLLLLSSTSNASCMVYSPLYHTLGKL